MSDYSKIKEKELLPSRKEIVERLIKNLEDGVLPWQKKWSGGQTAYNTTTNKEYRGINLVSIAMSPYSDPRWATFNQITDQKDWHLKKGSKGTPIEVFKHIDKRNNKDVKWDKIEEEIKDMTPEASREFLKENIRTLIKNYYIFNAEQIEGIPELTKQELTSEQLAQQNGRLEKIIANSEATIFYNGNGQNYYRPGDDTIHLCEIGTFNTMQDFYATALHEIGHSSGHSTRLNRDMSGRFGSASYAKEELRAELGSMFIQQDTGLSLPENHMQNHSAYIQSWIKLLKEKPSELFSAITDANKIAEYVVNRENTKNNQHKSTAKPINADVLNLAKEYGFGPQAAETALKVLNNKQEQVKVNLTKNNVSVIRKNYNVK